MCVACELHECLRHVDSFLPLALDLHDLDACTSVEKDFRYESCVSGGLADGSTLEEERSLGSVFCDDEQSREGGARLVFGGGWSSRAAGHRRRQGLRSNVRTVLEQLF